MGLSQYEQRTLDAIEEQLRKQDPILAFRLADFRPYRSSPPPSPPDRHRWRRWVAALAALVAITSLVTLAVLGGGGRRGASTTAPSPAQVAPHHPAAGARGPG